MCMYIYTYIYTFQVKTNYSAGILCKRRLFGGKSGLCLCRETLQNRGEVGGEFGMEREGRGNPGQGDSV